MRKKLWLAAMLILTGTNLGIARWAYRSQEITRGLADKAVQQSEEAAASQRMAEGYLTEAKYWFKLIADMRWEQWRREFWREDGVPVRPDI